MTTVCRFCNGTKIEPGYDCCIWCDNTGVEGGLSPVNPVTRYTAVQLRFATGELGAAQFVEAKHLDAALARVEALQQRLNVQDQRVDALEEREVLAQSEGVLTFMRSDDENSGGCACCDGAHVFCRYFEGMERFDDLTMKARFRNDLEGRRFRAVLQLLPGEALNPTAEAASHG